MAKLILKRRVVVVNCPRHGRIVPITGVNVSKDEIICNRCPDHLKETCGYVKCNAAK